MRISDAFFHEWVAPLADKRLGRTAYAAALLGGGSEVLGLDTDMSADHDWGPRVTVFVEPAAEADARSIAANLPDEFDGVSRRFGAAAGGAPWVHPFEVAVVSDFFDAWVGFHDRADATLLDWLATPAMSFLAVTAGAVFHDGPGQLQVARSATGWYPDDVWRWLTACQWRRVAEEQSFIERAAKAGDTLGATVIAARVVREAMRLGFLLEARYAPYSKWLGSAFSTLQLAKELALVLAAALTSPVGDGPASLSSALESLGALTNERFGLNVDASRRQYFTRAIEVAPADEFSAALLATIAAPRIAGLATNIGNVDMLFGTNNGGFPRPRRIPRSPRPEQVVAIELNVKK